MHDCTQFTIVHVLHRTWMSANATDHLPLARVGYKYELLILIAPHLLRPHLSQGLTGAVERWMRGHSKQHESRGCYRSAGRNAKHSRSNLLLSHPHPVTRQSTHQHTPLTVARYPKYASPLFSRCHWLQCQLQRRLKERQYRDGPELRLLRARCGLAALTRGRNQSTRRMDFI